MNYRSALLIVPLLLVSRATTAQCVVGVNAKLAFDGGDHVSIPYSATLSGFADFTFEAWVRRTGLAASGYGSLLTKWNYPATAEYSLTTDANAIFLSGAGGATLITAPYVFDTGWHHVALTRTGSTLQLFVDGSPLASSAYAATLGNALAAYPTRIGASSAAGVLTNRWIGDVDEVRIWNVHRTQAQIQAAMATGVASGETGLAAYWRFDEGSGQTLFNAALAGGSALDGSLGANSLPGGDDPTWSTSTLPPMPYCPPCTTPPCGQINSPCATLVVNGVGAAAQGPFDVVVPPAGSLTLDWLGPPNQPYVLVATSNLVPGQVVFPPTFVVDVDIASYFPLFSGFDPVWGPLYFTNAAGVGQQSWLHPSALPLGVTMNVQGLMYDLGLSCGGGLPFMTTASFVIHL